MKTTVGKTYFCLILSPQASNMASNIILPVFTCLQNFGYPMQFEGWNWSCVIEKKGVAISLKVLKTSHTPETGKKKQLSNRFGCWNCSASPLKCTLLALITAYHGLTVAILELSALRSY